MRDSAQLMPRGGEDSNLAQEIFILLLPKRGQLGRISLYCTFCLKLERARLEESGTKTGFIHVPHSKSDAQSRRRRLQPMMKSRQVSRAQHKR